MDEGGADLAAEAGTQRRERPLRADARRNRDRLIAVAGTAFAEHGVGTSLEDIARRADVGIGTLYRHFPTRERLVEVVYAREVKALSDAADGFLSDRAPVAALEAWLLRLLDYAAAKRGMMDSLHLIASANPKFFSEFSGFMTDSLDKLMQAAIAEGSIRSDLDSADVLQAISGIFKAPDTPDWRERSRRLVSLVMGGLRWGAPAPSA
ncbi:TetR/AcrR family transcriptional regulator [Mangrovibrevibacter kandeliae]|uniref:TetR/AcrR family transcriptional regulator n=1 Tax=Mangrovibrevibacter kandeliae TaxID=2968473 RepID=UPI0021176902|nr:MULTISPECIES: TetR family transcriptional regulator [unclassified Aurantimonas]MCQ8780581.1 TetR family transcriptional regulator [Aurantimonas sp. CSK15Z-1]MCW4113362.1 TetR family transcriptional regulator [Aurantimonas sp. MSK8Z-1]